MAIIAVLAIEIYGLGNYSKIPREPKIHFEILVPLRKLKTIYDPIHDRVREAYGAASI